MQSEFNAAQKEMPNVLFVVGLDIAQVVIRIFKLPLDKKIRTMRAIGFFVRFKHGLVVVAGEGRCGYVVSMKLHNSFLATRMSSYRNLPIHFARAKRGSRSKWWTWQHRMRFVAALRVRRNRLHAEVSA